MDRNSPKTPETPSEEVYALQLCQRWLVEQGGNTRIPQVLEILAEQTIACLNRGISSPAIEVDALQQLHLDRHGGKAPDTPASKWLPSGRVETWWDFRRSALDQALQGAGSKKRVDLARLPGGGRGNSTQYRFELLPLSEESPDATASSLSPAAGNADTVVYQAEPAKAAWWLRLLVGSQPFRMRSWRGYLLISLLAAEALFLLGLWLVVWLVMNRPRPVYAQDICLIAIMAFVTWSWWVWSQPLVKLPEQRVTIAGDLFLAASQFHGQMRLVRDAQSKLAGGWFQIVRHWAICPVCASEIEVADGGVAYPGRLVGRCSDSPLEHVYSFDPASMSGSWLLRRSLPEHELGGA